MSLTTNRKNDPFVILGIDIGSVSDPVEVDIYETPTPPLNHDVLLGVDIGSTSTKAVLLDTLGRGPAALFRH